jgi:hypothetical protein
MSCQRFVFSGVRGCIARAVVSALPQAHEVANDELLPVVDTHLLPGSGAFTGFAAAVATPS